MADGAVHIPNASPFMLIEEHINELFEEAKNHADGEPIATPGQAEAVQTLMRQIQAAKKAADAERVKENKPFDEGKAEVQARYAALVGDTKAVTGKAVLAENALKAHLNPWLVEQDRIQRAAAEAARVEAQRVAAAAAEALREAAPNDLGAREAAEAKVAEAKVADRAAKSAETARPQTAGQGRAATLRTSYKATLYDRRLACRYFFDISPEAFDGLIAKLASDLVAAGKRGDSIPGFRIDEVRSVV